MRIQIIWEGIKEWAQSLFRAKSRVDQLFEANFITLGHTVAFIMRDHMETKRYRGQMERSVSSEVSPRMLKVGPTAPYAGWVRLGSSPHWVPIEPLKEWARWKLGDASLAYPIQKKIARFGTEGFDYLEMTLQDARFQTALANTAERLGIELVAEIE